MNILIDIRPLMDERYSGVAEYTRLLLEHIFELDAENQYFLYYNLSTDISARLKYLERPNVRIIYTRIPNRLLNYPFLKLLGRPYFDRLAQRLTGQRIDLFFMPHINFAAWSPRVRSIVAVHDLSFIFFPEFFSWWKNLWHRMLSVKRLIGRFDTVVAFSENTAADIRTLTGLPEERLRIIPSGLEKKFHPLAEADPRLIAVRQKYRLPERFIFTLSTIEPRKNIEGLIEAFEILKKNTGLENVKLVIAGGRGWKAKPIYERAAVSTYGSDIIFLDYVPADDRIALYNAAAVFAFPSFYEGFGFPPLEAIACGTPTVVSTAACLPEVVGEAAPMIDPYNSSALAEALVRVLEDERLATALSARGIEQARKFNWEKTARAYLDLFKETSPGK